MSEELLTPSQELLKPSEIARIARVHPSTVRRWIKSGRMEADVSNGKRPVYHVKREDMKAFLELNTRKQQP